MAKRILPQSLPRQTGTLYPSPYDQPCLARERRRLGDAAGLTQFGINLLRLAPGVWSSQRHWHAGGDEFVYVLEGEVVLVTDAGEEILEAGACAGFKANDGDGHHLQNRGAHDALILEMGTRTSDDAVTYSDIDLALPGGAGGQYTHRDGTPYPVTARKGPEKR